MSYSLSTSTEARYKADVLTLDQWRDFIAAGRSKVARKCANNTVARLTDDGVAIRLHDTDIIIFNSDGTATLDSGGWRTVTTKERLNRYTNAGISQRNSVWYMSGGSLFYDGIKIKADGTVIAPKQPEAYERKLKDLKKQVKEYAKGFEDALIAGAVGYPSSGDCWGCLMRSKDGKTAFGNDHLYQHIKERYYVPSLLVNAGRDAGYRDNQIGLMGIGGQRVFIEPERTIYRYMVKQLQKDL